MNKPIKNYYSEANSFEMIQKILLGHKVSQFMFDYDDDGRIKALAFSMKIGEKFFAYKLPAKVESVEKIMYEYKNKGKSMMGRRELTNEEKDQAYRTAWANIRDWLDAQMALIDTQMVKFEEVFFPYMLIKDGKTTFFEAQSRKNFTALESGE